jgi:hypothetical protein
VFSGEATVTLNEEDTFATIVSLTNVVPGEYLFFMVGDYARSAGATTRRTEVCLTYNNNSNVTEYIQSIWTNSPRTSGGSSAVTYNIFSPSQTLGNDLFLRSQSATTAVNDVGFQAMGRIRILGTDNKTVTVSAKKETTVGTPTLLESMTVQAIVRLVKVD